MHCLNKLNKLPITVEHLQETGIGKTVNALRKIDGDVGPTSKKLVKKWKDIVENEEVDDEQSPSTISEFLHISYKTTKLRNAISIFYKAFLSALITVLFKFELIYILINFFHYIR